MLTSDLVRAKVQGKTLRPLFVDPTQPSLVEAATALWELFGEAVEDRMTRGDLDEAVAGVIADRSRPKVLKGLAKLLADRSTFEISSPVPPAELRHQVFRLARARGPLALERGPLERPVADDILAEVGSEHGLQPEQIRRALYADLKQNQQIEELAVPDPAWLLHRYNVALVQALLLNALSLRIRLKDPESPRMRQLFRQVKFHRLLHRAERRGKVLEIVLDGPTSLFKQSTKYGMALANFFPALLLQPGYWELEATILWTRAKHRKTLTLDAKAGLVSHYADRGGYRTREQEWFAERFDALECDWERSEGRQPIVLGNKGVLFPDFSFQRAGKRAHLEILGFWRHDDLARRIELLEEHGPGNVVLAVSRKLRGSKEALANAPDWVIDFAEIVPPNKVLQALEQIAR